MAVGVGAAIAIGMSAFFVGMLALFVLSTQVQFEKPELGYNSKAGGLIFFFGTMVVACLVITIVFIVMAINGPGPDDRRPVTST